MQFHAHAYETDTFHPVICRCPVLRPLEIMTSPVESSVSIARPSSLTIWDTFPLLWATGVKFTYTTLGVLLCVV